MRDDAPGLGASHFVKTIDRCGRIRLYLLKATQIKTSSDSSGCIHDHNSKGADSETGQEEDGDEEGTSGGGRPRRCSGGGGQKTPQQEQEQQQQQQKVQQHGMCLILEPAPECKYLTDRPDMSTATFHKKPQRRGGAAASATGAAMGSFVSIGRKGSMTTVTEEEDYLSSLADIGSSASIKPESGE